MDKTLRMSLLFDFYGPLLTKRQQDIFEMYFHDDLSLGEISEQREISRQAVFDMLKRSTAILESFEQKLTLVEKHYQLQGMLAEIQRKLEEMATSIDNKADLTRAICELQEKLKRILADS